ncbi:MAG: SDR family NAD(P)-dependent oxidoreductase [Candidatus Omnitrophica bacterium]|nr:SDR family NAD(P)-dependent oxidoreductase [Candidatus Omnitrophota bacterium]
MSWAGKPVLVTGAGGFIGSHLTEQLVQLGARTRAMVHYRSDGSWGWLDRSPVKDGVEVVAGDVRDPESVRRAVEGSEVVFHLAALIAIPYSYQAPSAYVATNVQGTLHILQACREAQVQRVVHTSTSEVYGTARAVPMSEQHPLCAQSPYAASKAAADKFAEAFFHSYGLPVVTLRPFNTYGPRQSARAVIPAIILQCLTGDVVQLGNMGPRRDLNFVGDIVEGFLAAAASPRAAGRTIHLGSGRETSIRELAEQIAQLSGKQVRIEQEAQRVRPSESEVERLMADPTLAQELLGWAPKVSLAEGLRTTIDWMQENLDGYRAGAYAV